MRWNSRSLSLVASALMIGIMLLVVACGAPEPFPTPKPTPAPTPTPTPAPTPTPEPTPTPTPTLPPGPPLELVVMVPKDGTATPQGEESVELTVGTWGIPVVGTTRVDAVVTVYGTPVNVNEDGMFVHSVGLAEGPNLVEITASDLLGNQCTISMVVYQVSSAGIPLYVFWPVNDATVNSASVPVIGATNVDAVVTVNGVPVEVDVLGIFSISVTLEEGPNIIEVTASDLLENVQSQTVVVFRVP